MVKYNSSLITHIHLPNISSFAKLLLLLNYYKKSKITLVVKYTVNILYEHIILIFFQRKLNTIFLYKNIHKTIKIFQFFFQNLHSLYKNTHTHKF